MKTSLLILLICLSSQIKAQSLFSKESKVQSIIQNPGDWEGHSVAVSGNFAVIGAPLQDTDELNNNSMTNAGAAYVYEKNASGNWVLFQKLVASNRYSQDLFGFSVSIDGNYIVVTAQNHDRDENNNFVGSNAGAAYIFELVSGTWTEIQKIVASDGSAEDKFGCDVDIVGDQIVIGAFNDDTDENNLNTLTDAGSAYIFEKDLSGTFIEQKKLVPNLRGSYDYFGRSVAITQDRVIVGAPYQETDSINTSSLSNAGAAYIWQKNTGTWSLTQKLTRISRFPEDYFGWSVDIDNDIAIVGSPHSNWTWSDDGAGFIFELDGAGIWHQEAILIHEYAIPSSRLGWSVGISGNTAVIASQHARFDEYATSSAIYNDAGMAAVFQKNISTTNWDLYKSIYPSDRINSPDEFARDISISGNTLLCGMYRRDISAGFDAGASYFYDNCVNTQATITENASCSYTVPSGDETYTAPGTFVVMDTIQNQCGADSIITINLTITDVLGSPQMVSVSDPTHCLEGSSNISIANSVNGVLYYLLDVASDTIVEGPYTGNGDSLHFYTDSIQTTSNYKVIARTTNYQGGAIDLNTGSKTYAAVPNHPSLEFTTGTIEFWANWDAPAAAGTPIISMGDYYDERFAVRYTPGAISIVNDGNQSSLSLPIGTEWNHIALVFEAGQTQVYLNGAFAGTINQTINSSFTGKDLLIGAVAKSSSSGSRLDDVRIWNTERTALQIADNYDKELQGNESGLIAYYKMDGHNTQIIDATSNQLHGYVINQGNSNIWVEGAFQTGNDTLEQQSGALSFDGVDDYVDLGNSFSLANNSFTVELYAKRLGTNAGHMIGHGTNSTNNGLHIRYNNDGTLLFGFFGNDLSAPSGAYSTDGNWHHYAFTYDASANRRKIFVDGVEVASDNPGTDYQGTGNFTVGRALFLSDPWTGDIAKLAIWDKFKSNSEIVAAANSCLMGNESGLVAFYPMDEGQGSHTIDLSGYDDNGVLNNMDTVLAWTSGAFSCADFYSCQDETAAIPVTISPLDDASFSYNSSALCELAPNELPTITGLTGGTFSGSTGLNISSSSGEIDLNTTSIGNYDVIYQTNGACPNSDTVQVSVNSKPELALNFSTPPACFGGSDGSALVNATQGTPTYNYVWSNGGTSNAQTSLAAGTYSVYLSDANGCMDTLMLTINEPPALSVTPSVDNNISCFGATDGILNTSVSGGTAGYTYSWSNGATSATNPNLGDGTYTVTVTDANGCNEMQSITLIEPTQMQLVTSVDSLINCFGGQGTISVASTGGTPGYQFLWSTGDTLSTLDSVNAGSYEVIVTDANGCIDSSTLNLTEPLELTSSANINDMTSCISNDGSINLTIVGGTGSYVYDWDIDGTGDQDDSQDLSALSAGSYSVVTSDANGCVDSFTVSINGPALPSAIVDSIHHVSCFSLADGEAFISVPFANGSYNIDWNGMMNSMLPPGTHEFVLTDSLGCTYIDSVAITEPPVLSLSAATTDEMLGNDGSIDLTVSGGTPQYTFDWDLDGQGDFDDNEDLTGLASGSYSVIVMDDNGCTDTLDVFVASQVGINLNDKMSINLYPNPNNGTFTLDAQLEGKSYQLEIRDINGKIVHKQLINQDKTLITIDMSRGLYLVEIAGDEYKQSLKLVIQ